MRVQIKAVLGLCLSLAAVFQSYGQFGYYQDALRFSEFRSSGSARIMGLGGTQMSLGGDVSNIHANPAGLGFFRRSEFSVSPSFGVWNTESDYLGQLQTDKTNNFALPNISVVLSKTKGPLNTDAFRGGSFGISFNRMNHYNTQFGYFSDLEGETSIIDYFLQQAQGIPESQIENQGLLGLAYNTFLINPITVDQNGNPINNPSEYFSFVGGLPFQDETITTEGRTSQTSFSYGANFYNKIFIGGGVGLSSIIFRSRRLYGEEFFNEPLLTTNLQENLSINGFGANINLGLIVKPISILNLGFNFQSPTWYAMDEQYEARMVSVYDNFEFEEEDLILGREEAFTPIVLGRYNLNTPLRMSGGATLFLGKIGFITADIDYLDYSRSSLSSRDFNTSSDNQAIRTLYGQTFNYRAGAEFRFDILRIRGGYALYGDPFKDSSFDRTMQQVTGGLGLRFKTFYTDFAMTYALFDGLYNSYPFIDNDGFNIGPFTETRNQITSGILTLGFNF
jgi:long-subunit fatty acid transport protein